MIYTGDRASQPSELSLCNEFFGGAESSVEIKVRVLYGTDKNDILSQYVTFTKVYDEQRKIFGRTRAAILETIRICMDADVLRDYLKCHEREVITMMMTLYDDAQIMKNHDATLRREVTEQVTQQGIIILVQMCKKMQGSVKDAVEAIMSGYGMDQQKASMLVGKYW